jgi:hypothetical protein
MFHRLRRPFGAQVPPPGERRRCLCGIYHLPPSGGETEGGASTREERARSAGKTRTSPFWESLYPHQGWAGEGNYTPAMGQSKDPGYGVPSILPSRFSYPSPHRLLQSGFRHNGGFWRWAVAHQPGDIRDILIRVNRSLAFEGQGVLDGLQFLIALMVFSSQTDLDQEPVCCYSHIP